jgi:FMN phosphatase YigB (HAD superfamily)
MSDSRRSTGAPPQSLTYGLDYDGTIADTNLVKARWIREHLGIEVEPWRCDRTSCLPIIGPESYERLAGAVYERELSLAAPPVAGALAALEHLSARGRIVIVTARLPRRIAYAREWLRVHGAEGRIAAIVSSSGSDKLARCRAEGVDVLIDDDERHLALAQAAGLSCLWLRSGLPAAVPAGGTVPLCRSWPEALALLNGGVPAA